MGGALYLAMEQHRETYPDRLAASCQGTFSPFAISLAGCWKTAFFGNPRALGGNALFQSPQVIETGRNGDVAFSGFALKNHQDIFFNIRLEDL
jgi:hypothetical protein